VATGEASDTEAAVTEFELAQAAIFDMTDLANPWPKYRELLDKPGTELRYPPGLREVENLELVWKT
jgi:hypothetical protein